MTARFLQSPIEVPYKMEDKKVTPTNSRPNSIDMKWDSMGVYGLIHADLPEYDSPPPWIPKDERATDPQYNNELHHFVPRTVRLVRCKLSDQLGFNIRGGKEYHCGIFISKVVPGSEPHFQGLKEGDQILVVNDVDFTDIEHPVAVRVLKRNLEIDMTVKFFPFAYEKTYDKTRFLQSIQQRQQQKPR